MLMLSSHSFIMDVTRDMWLDYRTRLLRFVRSRVHDDVLAEDIVHDSLLKALQKIESLASTDALLPWMFQITMNKIRDHYRRHQPGNHINSEEVADVLPDEINTSQLQQFSGCMIAMTNTLEPEQRDALLRNEIYGQTIREIARDLGLSESGVKSRVQRARTRVRDAMIACCKLELNNRGQITNADDVHCSC